MSMTLKEQASQSGLVLLDETAEWNGNDWPLLEGGWRYDHASVVLDHLGKDKDYKNNQEQTVVVFGGYQTGQGCVNSVLLLNIANTDKQWREGPAMNKSRCAHAAVVCNGEVYVVGGRNRERLDCIEQIDANDLLQSSLATSSAHENHWRRLRCRLSTRRDGCCAVAVHNRYIVVMGGYSNRYLSSVDIIDTSNHSVTVGPCLNVPRGWCASVVISHRIFVVGGHNKHANLDSVEYLDYATTTPYDSDDIKKETGSTVISFSSTWITHCELVLSNRRSSCAGVAVGSCLVVAGGCTPTVEVLDTNRNRVWNLPRLENPDEGCSMVTVANQIAVIGGFRNASCATLPLLDKNTWCFRRLCEQPRNDWLGIRYVNRTSGTTST